MFPSYRNQSVWSAPQRSLKGSANPIEWSNTLKQFFGFCSCRRIVWVCQTILWDWCLKGYQLKAVNSVHVHFLFPSPKNEKTEDFWNFQGKYKGNISKWLCDKSLIHCKFVPNSFWCTKSDKRSCLEVKRGPEKFFLESCTVRQKNQLPKSIA